MCSRTWFITANRTDLAGNAHLGNVTVKAVVSAGTQVFDVGRVDIDTKSPFAT